MTRSGVASDFRPLVPKTEGLEQMGLTPLRRYILVVGQGAPYKNHEGAIRAFAMAFELSAGIDLVLVQRRGGRGLAELIAALNLENRVRVLEAVGREDLVRLYCGAAALLHPSFIEGFGNPVAEAMACGCPVITSNCSAMPEVAGGAALLVDPHDTASIAAALSRVTQDGALAADLRQRGLMRAAELNWIAFAAANLALYRRALEISA
ncbi:glycosyltransferase family 1 protein [Kamptonema cortianum]|nr:glycosyltransferase family 1 protein [Kamptonema cortianum]